MSLSTTSSSSVDNISNVMYYTFEITPRLFLRLHRRCDGVYVFILEEKNKAKVITNPKDLLAVIEKMEAWKKEAYVSHSAVNTWGDTISQHENKAMILEYNKYVYTPYIRVSFTVYFEDKNQGMFKPSKIGVSFCGVEEVNAFIALKAKILGKLGNTSIVETHMTHAYLTFGELYVNYENKHKNNTEHVDLVISFLNNIDKTTFALAFNRRCFALTDAKPLTAEELYEYIQTKCRGHLVTLLRDNYALVKDPDEDELEEILSKLAR